MPEQILRHRVGRTPLVRAKKLEKQLGISKIYLKLEGNNPSGHREDRMAYLIIRDSLSRGKKTICIGTMGTVGKSLSYLAQFFDVECVFLIPRGRKRLKKQLIEAEHVKVIEHGRTYEDCVVESRKLSEANDWYNANPGQENNITNMHSFSYLAKEVHNQTREKVDTIFCQTSNGSSVSGLHLGLKDMWVNEKIETMPKIMAVSTDHGNAIVESFKQGSKKITTLSVKDVKQSRYNRAMINLESYNGQDALNGVYDTLGKVIGVTDEELLDSYSKFRKLERINLSQPNSYTIAAFMKEVRKKNLTDGAHVIILNDGRVNLDLRAVTKDELLIPYKDFLKTLDKWLLKFSDPIVEMKDAVDDAFENGFVICAHRHDELVGIVILSTGRYEKFFPKYHLSYVATKSNIRGMGIATQLFEKAIELTKGDFSLHVETDNKRAIKFYEKMGLRKKYFRMYYEGEVADDISQNQ